jgi:hypothetical protein
MLVAICAICAAGAEFASPARAQTVASDDATGQAPLEGTDTVGVLEVATEGVSDTAGEKFQESLEETLSDVGFRVVRSKAVQERLITGGYVPGCTFGPCMREVNRLTGLRRVLVARISGAGQSYSVVVSLVETETGHLLSQVAQSCPVCTVEEAISTATLAVVELITDRSAAAGGSGEADPMLRLGPGGERASRGKRRVRRAGWLFLGLGAAVGGVGGYLLATDRGGDAGLPMAGGGGALAIAGITSLLLSRSF